MPAQEAEDEDREDRDEDRVERRPPPRRARSDSAIEERRRPGPRSRADDEEDRPAPRSRVDDEEDTPVPRRKRRRRRRRESERSGYGKGALSSIIVGVLMMVGAVVWFVGGLAVGFIFFYPPFLFIFGIVAVVRGLMGHD
jgi:hypothetical protein